MARRPSTRTRLRFGDRPRRSTTASPPPGLFEKEPRPGTTCGSWLITCSTFGWPDRSIASELTVWIGLLLVAFGVGISVPVTTTVSIAGAAEAEVETAITAADAAPRSRAALRLLLLLV